MAARIAQQDIMSKADIDDLETGYCVSCEAVRVGTEERYCLDCLTIITDSLYAHEGDTSMIHYSIIESCMRPSGAWAHTLGQYVTEAEGRLALQRAFWSGPAYGA